MSERFQTKEAESLFEKIKPRLQDVLEHVEHRRFDEVDRILDSVLIDIRDLRKLADGEDVLRDLFAVEKYVGVISAYRRLWQRIWLEDYPASWNALQDALDRLRLVKRFSNVDVSFLEDQLTELESGYPYRVFASIGAIVDRFECSICGLDIDGLDCIHRRCEVYSGQMAYGIARNITSLDHVSLVLNPEDKRCVMQIADSPHQFPVLEYIREQWGGGTLRIGWLSHLERSTRRIPNPDYQVRGRNEPCYCGGSKKFKKCCADKQMIERDHIELVGERRDIREAVV